MVELAERKTPLLRWRGALLKLECLRPAGGFDDRAVAIFPTLAPGTEAALAATGPGALAAAAFHRLVHQAIQPSNIVIVPGQSADGGWPMIKLVNFGRVKNRHSLSVGMI